MAALSAWHEQHDLAARTLADVTVLPAHAVLETYSVLTRLPAGLAVPAEDAAAVLGRRFGATTLALADEDRNGLVARLAGAGVFGGATYDGLVALEAHAHGHVLLTLDRRAQDTYRRLGIDHRAL